MRGVIAHYKFNEDTAGDNVNLIGGGDFATGDWVADNPNPTYWTVSGEVTTDPEISQVGAGQGHGGAGTGYCNIYTTGDLIKLTQSLASLIIGRKYRCSININKVTAGYLRITETTYTQWVAFTTSALGITTWVFTATHADINIEIKRLAGLTDITFDDVSIKLLAVKDFSGSNHHDGLAQQDTSVIHRAGRISGAFDFTPNDHIVIPDHDDFSPGAGTPGSGKPFSISAWVYMHSAAYFVIVGKGVFTGDFDGEYRFFVASDGTLRIRFIDEDATAYIGRLYSLDLRTAHQNQWLHLVATYDGGTSSSGCKLYLNGVNVDNFNHESNPGAFVAVENLGSDVRIGRYGTRYANGLIDNMMFFNRVLSAREIHRQFHLYRVSRGRSRDRVYSDYGSR